MPLNAPLPSSYPPERPPAVAVLVLNWNGRRFLQPCLDSLRAQTYRDFEVVLVDNGSSDGSIEFIRHHFGEWLAEPQARPRLKLVTLPGNTGFSGGNLAGLAAVHPETPFIATLNNDTRAHPDWLARLVAGLENATPDWAAACGPMLFAAAQSGEPVIASAGIEIQKNGLALDRALGRPWQPTPTPEEIFGPCAGAALYRRSALNTIGFFDPDFFAYLEDADLAWRLRLRGGRTLYLPEAPVWHEYSGTGGQGSPFKNYQLGRNRVWVILKNWPGPLLLRHGWRIGCYDLAACAYTLLKGNIQPARGRLAALHPRHLRRVLVQRRELQRTRSVPVKTLESWLVQPSGPVETLRLRRTAGELAAATPLHRPQ